MTTTIRVELGTRAYDVAVGTGTLASLGERIAAAGLGDANAFALVADRAAGVAVATAATALRTLGRPVLEIPLDVTEGSKSIAGFDALIGALIDGGFDRRGVIVALGGGVVGDLAGFAAASFARGVPWVGIPTTLLAAVDSAIGGKTGINHERGKNLIGAIHQPSLVVVDPATFATLPRRERVSGYGEMLKYGLALDAPLWDDLISTDPDDVTEAQIARCIELKARIVAVDEHDLSGVRERLNFGHTIGHAYESATSYAYYRHGEAVVLGMRAALRVSTLRGHCERRLSDRLDEQLAAIALPSLPVVDRAALLAAIGRDKKKAAGGATRFVLLRTVGDTVGDAHVERAVIETALDALEAACASRL